MVMVNGIYRPVRLGLEDRLRSLRLPVPDRNVMDELEDYLIAPEVVEDLRRQLTRTEDDVMAWESRADDAKSDLSDTAYESRLWVDALRNLAELVTDDAHGVALHDLAETITAWFARVK